MVDDVDGERAEDHVLTETTDVRDIVDRLSSDDDVDLSPVRATIELQTPDL